MPDDGPARSHQGRPSPTLTTDTAPLLLGLDLGTSGIKALLVDRHGGERAAAAVATPFEGGEMTTDQLVAAMRRAIRRLDDDARAQVVAVGIAGMAESGAPLDRDGRAVAPIIAWYDPRGAEVVERLLRTFGPDLERSIGQRLRTVSSVAKLGWLVEHGVGPVDRWLGVPELALQALTGRQATEFSLAARTGGYHVGERRYLDSVLRALGVTPEVFPQVLAAGQAMGRIAAEGAAWSGLPEGVPVTVAGHDHLVGWAGSGAGPEDLGNSVGTAETVVAAASGLPDVDRCLSQRVAVTVLPAGKGWALLASAARSGIVLSAVAHALGCSAWELDALAVVARASGRRVDRVAGDAMIEAAVSGRPIELGAAAPGAVWDDTLHALAARAWDAVDRLGHAAGRPVAASGCGRTVGDSGLVVFGGGSRSRPWLDAKAAARADVAVWRSPATEAVARGAALYAGVAVGWWPSAEAAPGVALERVAVLPRPGRD